MTNPAAINSARFHRFRFRYSLTTLLFLFPFVTIVIGWYAERIQRQRELIASLGGRPLAHRVLLFDCQDEYSKLSSSTPRAPPDSPTDSYPKWLVDLLSEDAFISVIGCDFGGIDGAADDRIVNAVCGVRTLKYIKFGYGIVTRVQKARILKAHPNIEVLWGGTVIEDCES